MSALPRRSVAWGSLQRVPPDIRMFTPGLAVFSSPSVRRPSSAPRVEAKRSAVSAPTTRPCPEGDSMRRGPGCSAGFVQVVGEIGNGFAGHRAEGVGGGPLLRLLFAAAPSGGEALPVDFGRYEKALVVVGALLVDQAIVGG